MRCTERPSLPRQGTAGVHRVSCFGGHPIHNAVTSEFQFLVGRAAEVGERVRGGRYALRAVCNLHPQDAAAPDGPPLDHQETIPRIRRTPQGLARKGLESPARRTQAARAAPQAAHAA
mmetsp:Transcript_25017/g.11923  ORF Transcript_25017/g.11923 Transcript_25017/m.11923 type:complete len:118 (+) Transcript_25017:1108-1461(+)